MITITSVLGNIHRDKGLKKRYDQMRSRGLCETINIHRLESQRVRMRKISDRGTDVAMTLPPGNRLRHGDVLLDGDDKMVVVELEPENVAVVEITHLHEDDMIEVPVKIGHTIGNLHRPLKLEGDKIYFPIQTESEVEMFKKLLNPLSHHIEIKSTRMVFEPEEGTDVHEH